MNVPVNVPGTRQGFAVASAILVRKQIRRLNCITQRCHHQSFSRSDRMATSERQVHRITNNWSFPANDSSRIFTLVPIFASSSTISLNQANCALAQHTSDTVVSTHARVRFGHNPSFLKSPEFLQITKEWLTRSLSSSKASPWICAVAELG